MPLITALQNTIAKSSSAQSSTLPENEKWEFLKDNTLDVTWVKQEGNHLKFELKTPVNGRFNWYLFKDHVKLSEGKLLDSNISLAQRVVNYMESKDYKLFKSKDECNLIGLEGINPDGQLNKDELDKWNDLIGVLKFNSSGIPYFDCLYRGTTEPGRFYTINPLNPNGAARLVPGQYTAWQLGLHRGRPGLVQCAPLSIQRDRNKDGSRAGDVLTVENWIGINIHRASRASLNSIGPWCLSTQDTEVLTPNGWIEAKDYSLDSEVLVFNNITGKSEWVFPTALLREDYKGDMILHKANKIEMLVTPNHSIPLANNLSKTKGQLQIKEYKTAEELYYYNKPINIPISAELDTSSSFINTEEAKLIISFLADGYEDEWQYRWHLKRQRKIDRLKSILDSLKIKYKETKTKSDTTYIRFRKCEYPNLTKNIDPAFALKLPLDIKIVMLQELIYWDGSKSNRSDTSLKKLQVCIGSVRKNHIDFYELLAITSGYGCTRNVFVDKRNLEWKPLYKCNIIEGRKVYNLNRPETSTGSWTSEVVKDYDNSIFCLTTYTSNFWVRHRGKIFLTGNSAGCSVIFSEPEFIAFYNIVSSDPRVKHNKRFVFTYTLILAKDLY